MISTGREYIWGHSEGTDLFRKSQGHSLDVICHSPPFLLNGVSACCVEIKTTSTHLEDNDSNGGFNGWASDIQRNVFKRRVLSSQGLSGCHLSGSFLLRIDSVVYTNKRKRVEQLPKSF